MQTIRTVPLLLLWCSGNVDNHAVVQHTIMMLRTGANGGTTHQVRT
jgi:hypothetical protein